MIKKLIALTLSLVFIFTLASCSDGSGAPASAQGKTTLMIYMVGSDLESNSGAGTDDMIEIQDSGVDLSKNDVIIYTGGSSEWQNDIVDSEKNLILNLSDDGYTVEESLSQSSMGESDTMAYFLNYCAEKHPADHYSLILWNHGNGPLIGYGKDILYENDSLTLTEMKDAMEKSPFSKDNKLDWVGFDACLMASAELACIWEPYANYLVASQEVEPAFGWKYSFLQGLGSSESTALINNITDNYLQSCLEYFQKKDYKDRDTTLACMDLSFASDLSKTVNALFSAASKDVKSGYDALTSRRVNTRALGRASTGSEYDLVDLKDLAENLEGSYPDESKALIDIIDKMVVANSTNAQGLSGMSLYYPFYNKSYYENEWKDTYSGMNVFPDYVKATPHNSGVRIARSDFSSVCTNNQFAY